MEIDDMFDDDEDRDISLSLAGKVEKQEPVAWKNAHAPNGLLRFMTQKQYDANPKLQKYYEPFRCAECEKLKAERDNAWEELRRVRDAVVANIEESTFDEVRRVVAERDELAAQVEQMRGFAEDNADVVSKALLKAWQLGQTYWQQADSDYVSQNKKSDETQAKFQTLVDETRSTTLALPDLSTNILNRVRAETAERCAKACEEVRDDWVAADMNLKACAADYLVTHIRALAADMEAGKCQVY